MKIITFLCCIALLGLMSPALLNAGDDATRTDGTAIRPGRPQTSPRAVLEPPIVNRFPTPDGATRGIAFDGAYLWAANSGDGNSTNGHKIYRVDPATGAAIDTFTPPANSPCGLAWDGQYLWMGSLNHNIYKCDTATMASLKSFAFPSMAFDMAWDGQYLYCVAGNTNQIFRLDTAAGAILDTVFATYPADAVRPFGLECLPYYNGSLWAANDGSATNTINAWDFNTETWVDQWSAAPAVYPCGLAYDSVTRQLWVSCWTMDSIYQFDLTTYGISETGSRSVQSIGIAPNPFIGSALIKGETTGLRLYDATGRNLGPVNGRFFGAGLNPGVYFLKLDGAQPIKAVKLR